MLGIPGRTVKEYLFLFVTLPAMPKISDEQWEERRRQILEAAWRCFHRKGVQPTTMEDIIAESQMAASAMYRYFRGKDDIILSAITASLGTLAQQIGPLIQDPTIATPMDFVARVLGAIERFSQREGYNLLPIAIHGWSEAQRDERVRELLNDFYGRFRAQIAQRVAAWQQQGTVGREASALELAQTLQSTILGFIVLATIMRDVSVAGLARGIGALAGVSYQAPGKDEPMDIAPKRHRPRRAARKK